MQIQYDDLEYAFQLVSAGHGLGFDTAAFLDRETGGWLLFDEGLEPDDDPRTPDDLLGNPRYLAAPSKQALDLGTDLAFDFVRAHLPDAQDEVQAIFRRRGAWGRFKDLLDRRDRLDAWHRYEDARTRAALIEWAEGHGLVVVDAAPPNG
jgi:hypothetical protein